MKKIKFGLISLVALLLPGCGNNTEEIMKQVGELSQKQSIAAKNGNIDQVCEQNKMMLNLIYTLSPDELKKREALLSSFGETRRLCESAGK